MEPFKGLQITCFFFYLGACAFMFYLNVFMYYAFTYHSAFRYLCPELHTDSWLIYLLFVCVYAGSVSAALYSSTWSQPA